MFLTVHRKHFRHTATPFSSFEKPKTAAPRLSRVCTMTMQKEVCIMMGDIHKGSVGTAANAPAAGINVFVNRNYYLHRRGGRLFAVICLADPNSPIHS